MAGTHEFEITQKGRINRRAIIDKHWGGAAGGSHDQPVGAIEWTL
jgi:hypothetical protein